ncbi:G-protein coupled receptor Mth2-like isoform X1 [Lucilia sericata]|uniref:G-protein coupled receptor Mth2-like isoform X1 n=1 Tax=Lucilia sericata TaxID=13632 RepID=UPI0018A8261B|nr:G-protein coupled receptor Mth2-like isoform X1 [Lucilia sericata]XP_037811116.1 G-protein coupled receptor Mth2-like isoform X1 [Lucilia sericata]XP_037811117.1 G-protein coupled receptor Mth2-like isoform X1 [Lucilia sericata]XP_037811118.1 G-protein coupled receptor Mth2-like isoform X1 [Lucilia sericata]
MNLKTNLRIYILFAVFQIYHNTEIPNCAFEDTVNLTNALQFDNGSYLYAYEGIVIPPDLVRVYDFEEIYDGRRLPVEPHLRGCICKGRNCIKFCCHPTKELITNMSRMCSEDELKEELEYDPYLEVIYNNGSRLKTHAIRQFVVIQGVPCEGGYPLMPQEDEDDKWDIFENGTIYRHFDQSYISKRDYCLMPQNMSDGTWVLNPMNCPIPNEATLSNRINNIAMAISVPFIVLTIFVYLFIPELRNLHGKCLISYLTSLAVGYSVLSTITLSEVIFANFVCSSLGYIGYFSFMAAFFWLSVISFDLWQNFRITGPIRIGQRKRFIMYSTYAWGVPFCLTCIVMIIQNSDMDPYYKPGIGDDYCWLKTNDWSAMIYFFGINLIIILLDTAFFIMTLHKILIIQREIKKVTMNDGGNDKSRNLRLHKNNVGLFLRLLLIMGITWLLDIFSYIENQLHPGVTNPLYYISDFMNAMTGLLIFICFVLKPKVLKLMKRRILGKEEPSENTESDYSDDEFALEDRGKNDALQFIN